MSRRHINPGGSQGPLVPDNARIGSYAMNEDDAADLQALQTHLVETLAIYQAIKEPNA